MHERGERDGETEENEEKGIRGRRVKGRNKKKSQWRSLWITSMHAPQRKKKKEHKEKEQKRIRSKTKEEESNKRNKKRET